ncbi:hypothetical protein QFZ44_003263 [Pantoea agglomerans]|nr:hypothetical protein [Pantoea agglomerans]
MHVQMVFVRAQRFSHHKRAEVRAADTDIHHVGDRFTGIAFPFAADDALREAFHLIQHRVDLWHHIFAIHQNRRVTPVTQRDVQHRTIFGAVNLLTREHRLNGTAQVGLFGQRL